MDKNLTDLKILAETAEADKRENNYTSCNEYLTEFNRLLIAFGIPNSDISQINPLSTRELSPMGPGFGTIPEKAKLTDIVTKCKRLLARVDVTNSSPVPDALNFINQICSRFHTVTRQLQKRHSNRNTISIDDEYDVQDLFHALLKIFFDDVREEEYSPSYAGGASRIDFLLKDEKILIEIKKTRKGLADKQIGEELLVDIAKYQEHPDCKKLVCFVYDPEARIGNPRGLESDLKRHQANGLEVVVYVRPVS